MARVLVVDHGSVRRLARMLLEMDGHEVVEAADALTAFRTLERDPPDVLVVDPRAPWLEGYGLLRRVSRLNGSRPRTIVVSGPPYGCEVAEALDSWVDAFLPKPFDPWAFLRLVSGFRGDGAVVGQRQSECSRSGGTPLAQMRLQRAASGP